MRRWRLGEVFVLRHAGFPFDWLEELGLSANVADAAARVLDAEEGLLALAREDGGQKKEEQAKDAILRGRAPQPPKSKNPKYDELKSAWETARAELSTRYAEERTRLVHKLRERAREKMIQDAVYLSNPAIYDNVWSRFVKSESAEDSSDARRVERQVYTYLQRFCAKNETVSFFGPMGYGERTGKPGGVEVVPTGDSRRRSFFAYWAVTELSHAIEREPELSDHVPVRPNPLFSLDEGRARSAALGVDAKLSPLQARICDAAKSGPSLVGIARALELSLEDAKKALGGLLRAKVLLQGFALRTQGFDTFDSLKEQVDTLPACAAKTKWQAELASLGERLEKFQNSFLPERREHLGALEARFTELTGQPARRGEGQVYADRLVLYEEGASPFGLRFGEDFVEQLERALSAPLELSAAFGEKIQKDYRQAIAQTLSQEKLPLDFVSYSVKTRPQEVSGSRFAPVPPVELPPSDAPRLELPVDHLGVSSPGARYALPDVCLGKNPDGRFEIMCARVHHHLLLWSWLSAFYGDKRRYQSVARSWLEKDPDARDLTALTVRRRNKGFYVFPGKRLSHSVSDTADLDEEALPGRLTTVDVKDGDLVLRAPDGQPIRLYLTLDDFSHYPPFAALAHPLVLHAKLKMSGAHQPRIRIGEAVYQRETWILPGPPLASRPSGVEMYLQLRREERVRKFPRFVFARTPAERKPYLIDTHSPFALELLRHLAREQPDLSFQEMYPAPEQLWLKDARGRYTCELRMQFNRWSTEDVNR